MSKTFWLSPRELEAIRSRLEYVDGIDAGPTGGKLSTQDPVFASAKRVVDEARPGDQVFLGHAA